MDSTTLTIVSTVVTILALGITIWLTNRSTQKVIRELHKDSIKIMRQQHQDAMKIMRQQHRDAIKIMRQQHQDAIKIMQQQHQDSMAILKEIVTMQKNMIAMQEEILTIQKDTHCILKKLAAANIYNAKVNGHELLQNVTREDAEKVGTIFYYDEETKLAWVKPAS